MRLTWNFKGAYTAKRRSIKVAQTDKHRQKRRQGLRYRSSDACALFWDNLVSNEALFKQLSSEAKLLWFMHGGDRGSAKSFWISRTATPKCTLELFAQRIASFHCTRAGGECQCDYPSAIMTELFSTQMQEMELTWVRNTGFSKELLHVITGSH